jgi:hypothetical protein
LIIKFSPHSIIVILGLEEATSKSGIILIQQKYAPDLLEDTGLLEIDQTVSSSKSILPLYPGILRTSNNLTLFFRS